MPLDTGAIVEGLAAPNAARDPNGRAPTLIDPAPLGEILREARLHRGLDLEDLARLTRVRLNYLAAIEHMRFDLLPSRPFALGYVRAYASALGLDADLAAARFKVEAPEAAEPLRAPMGVRREGDPRLKLLGLTVAIVVAAIVSWNVARHLLAADPSARRAAVVVTEVAAKPHALGPVALGAPLPAPPESTTPQPYVTPGLEQTLGVAPATGPQAEPVGSPFVAKGAVYGAAPAQSEVIVQARQGASLVVHGGDGSVYFARLLAPGEAYRAPQIKGLTIDVSEPEKFDVYVGGLLQGPLAGPKTATTELAASRRGA
jgi:transcriptional regulator with XRE-family HTH domain